MIARAAGSVYTVQYRCIYREHWYDDSDHQSIEEAAARAHQLAVEEGRTVRVVDHYGWVVGVISSCTVPE